MHKHKCSPIPTVATLSVKLRIRDASQGESVPQNVGVFGYLTAEVSACLRIFHFLSELEKLIDRAGKHRWKWNNHGVAIASSPQGEEAFEVEVWPLVLIVVQLSDVAGRHG